MDRSSPKKIRKLFTSIALGLSLFAGLSSALAQEINITASVDKNELTLEDALRYSVILHGAQNAPAPDLPSRDDFKTQQLGTSSSTQIINGQMSVSTTYNYRLTPLKEGTLIIPPATIVLEGNAYATEPVTITVFEPSAQGSDSPSVAFVKSYVSNANPFVNEQIVYTFKLFRAMEANNLELEMPFAQLHFHKEELGKVKRYRQTIDGVRYHTHELSIALFPIRPGKTEIPPAVLELDLLYPTRNNSRGDPFSRFFSDPFFGGQTRSEHKVLRTQHIPIGIKPLPEKGKPADFSNLVGQFDLTAKLGKEELEAGDSSTLTLTVSGTGNIKNAALPAPKLEKHFKIYPDQPEFKQTVERNIIGGTKTFKFALVPTKEGLATLPAFSISYFDPAREAYRTVQTRSITMNVLPSSAQERLNVVDSNPVLPAEGKNSTQLVGRDILPIHTTISDFNNEKITPGQIAVFFGWTVLPIVLFFVIGGSVTREMRMKQDPAFYKRRGAYKMARKKLDSLASASDVESKRLVGELSQILREYVGNKLNLEGRAFTSMEVEAKLKARNIEEEQAVSTRTLLEKYESLQYDPTAAGDNKALLSESMELLKRLEKQA